MSGGFELQQWPATDPPARSNNSSRDSWNEEQIINPAPIPFQTNESSAMQREQQQGFDGTYAWGQRDMYGGVYSVAPSNIEGIITNGTNGSSGGLSNEDTPQAWHDEEQGGNTDYPGWVYNAEMIRADAAVFQLQRRMSSKVLPPTSEDDFKKLLLDLDQPALLEATARLLSFLQSRNLEKEAEALLNDIAPHLKIPSVIAENELEFSPANIRAILDAGFERFLRRIKHRVPGLTPLEVRYKNLSYTAKLQLSHSTIVTVGSDLKKMLWPFGKKEMKEKVILNNLNGILRPGKITLVLGLPSSGKTSFLQALSGRVFTDANSKLTGDLLINGKPHGGEGMFLRRMAAYVGQRETHLPLLTVRETFEFALHCLLTKHQDDLRDLFDTRVDSLLHTIGLYHVADGIVGDELVRGVSGGERRRVTLGEMLTGPHRILCLDEISTGLDSASTFDIINSLRMLASVMKYTVVTALLQPLPDTFSLFDDIILLAKGNIIFHGPSQEALAHFASLGFERPPRVDIADFLLELTGPDAAQFYKGPPGSRSAPGEATGGGVGDGAAERIKFEMKVPGVEDLVHAWLEHPRSIEITRQLETKSEYDGIKDPLSMIQYSREFALETKETIKFCFDRQVVLTKRSLALIRVKIFHAIIMGIISGTLFYQMDYENFQLRYGFIFLATLTMGLGHMSIIPEVIKESAVFFKQYRANFFGIFPYLMASSVLQIPLVVVESTIFCAINYWLAGMSDSSAGIHFAIFWLFNVLCALTMSVAYRCFGYCISNPEMAQVAAGLYTVISAVFAGFMIPHSEIPNYWIWAYWGTPFMWALRSIVINEFKSEKFDVPIPSGGTLGDVYLDAFDFAHDKYWIWVTLAVLGGMMAIFLFLSYLGLRYSKFGSPPTVEKIRPPLPSKLPLTISNVKLPFEPIVLSFYDIKYTVEVKRGRKLTLLTGISGYARPGTITALMGASGAGKTTLLDVLAGRKNTGVVEGRIMLNGHPKDPITFSRVTGYVEQMDIHTATTTVREALMFSAKLRLPETVSKEDLRAFVEQVIDVLELNPIADQVVGRKEEGGLSTEQLKRLTIGVELVANPSILFLDEPTSGLDARGAAVVMRAIKNVAMTGRSIVCTIHQPSTELFNMFDRLLLLQRGGTVVYFGELGENSRTLIDYFESIPGTPKCAADANPASYMLEAIGAGVGHGMKLDFASFYLTSSFAAENQVTLEKMFKPAPGSKPLSFSSQYARSKRHQLRACLSKNFKSYWRMPEYNLVRSLFLTLMALIFGSLYYKNDPTTQTGAFARISVMFISTLFIGLVNSNTIMSVIIKERAVFYRERAAGMYSPGLYSLAAGIVEIPYNMFNSLVFCSIFYYMVDFKASAGNFFFYFLTFFLFTSMYTYFGQLLAVLAPSTAVAQAIGPIFVSLWNMFCGYLTPRPDIPNFWLFLYWSSPMRYYLEATVSDQFHCDSTECFSVNVITGTGQIVPMVGDTFVDSSFGMKYDNRWWCVLALAGFVALFRVLTSIVLTYVNHSTR